MGLLSGNGKSEVSVKIIFDIGSDSVGGSVVCVLPQTREPRVQYTVRTPAISSSEKVDYERLVEGILAAFRTTADAVHRYAASRRYHRLDMDIACGLSAVWCAVNVRQLYYEKEKPFSVSSSLVEDILSNDHHEQTPEEVELLRRKNITEPAIFERRILNIALNGYATMNPIGKRAVRVDIALFTAVMSLPFYRMLHEVLEEHFEETQVSFHSHALSLFTTVRDYLGASGDFLLLDVGDAVTDMVFVRDDIIVRTHSVPIGVHTILEAIATERKGALSEARSLMTLAAPDREEGAPPALDISSQEHDVVERSGMSWKQELARATRNVDGSTLTSHQIFVNAPADLVEWFASYIKRPIVNIDENKDTGSGKMIMVPTKLIQHFIAPEKNVPVDAILAVEALHVARL